MGWTSMIKGLFLQRGDVWCTDNHVVCARSSIFNEAHSRTCRPDYLYVRAAEQNAQCELVHGIARFWTAAFTGLVNIGLVFALQR